MSASTGDLRSVAQEQRRAKEQRVKYRSVNTSLIGKPVNEFGGMVRSSPTWTDNNKFRMFETIVKTSCHCGACKRVNGRVIRLKKRLGTSNPDMVCMAGSHKCARKPPRPSFNVADDYLDADEDYSSGSSGDDYEYSGDCHTGAVYSFDNAGPGHAFDLSHAVTEAVEKFENKELAILVKNEYEFVQESDTDEEFELI